MKIRLILLGLAASAALCAIAGTARGQILETNQTIAANAEIYGAGNAGLPDPFGGVLPPVFNLPASPLLLTMASVTGTISLNSGGGFNDPDGAVVSGGYGLSLPNASFASAYGGISGIKMPGAGALVGVFTPGTPPSGAAPANLDFTSIGTSFTSLSPALYQTFFIGDGKTGDGSGAVQQFNVPSGAKQLYLGISDAPGFNGSPGAYGDNSGSFTATFAVSVTAATHGSATWSLNPGSGNWNTAGNWNPATVPNGPTATATFGQSNTRSVLISANTEVNGVVFNSGASAFTITVSPTLTLTISGAGITNNSGVTQNFVTGVDSSGNFGDITFTNSATAGNMTVITNNGAAVSGAGGGVTSFVDSSTAGSATINNNGGTVSGAFLSQTNFSNTSTAGSATINNNAATVTGAASGGTFFVNSSSAGSATINNNGGTVSNGTISGGFTEFRNTATAASATLIANSGTSGGNGGTILFEDDSTGGTARVEVFGNGNLDISFHNAPGVTIGSIEGTGNVFLGANNLTVGSNNLSTTLSGVIQDGGFKGGTGGSLTKIGTGTLTLSGANTYTGPTAINAGVLNVTGSITSAVTVNGGGTLGTTQSLALTSGGTLSGGGTTGSVTVNRGGTVAPTGQHREAPPPIPGLSATGNAVAAASFGALHVNGDYVQNAGGTLVLGIAGATPGSFDQLIVTGRITLLTGAILELDFLNGFAPTKGEVFDFLSSGISSITGTFTANNVHLEGLAPGFEFDLGSSNNGTFDLTALNDGVSVSGSVPDASSTWTLLLLSLTSVFGLNFLLHHGPRTRLRVR